MRDPCFAKRGRAGCRKTVSVVGFETFHARLFRLRADHGAQTCKTNGSHRGETFIARISASSKVPYPKNNTIEPELIVRARTPALKPRALLVRLTSNGPGKHCCQVGIPFNFLRNSPAVFSSTAFRRVGVRHRTANERKAFCCAFVSADLFGPRGGRAGIACTQGDFPRETACCRVGGDGIGTIW